jgi:hypothetical protein
MLEWIIYLGIILWGVLLQIQISNIKSELDLEAMDKADLIDAFEKMRDKVEDKIKKKKK